MIVNNAGVMPLAFFADHERAWEKWHKAIDINIKGVVNGISAVYDTMIKQGRGPGRQHFLHLRQRRNRGLRRLQRHQGGCRCALGFVAG